MLPTALLALACIPAAAQDTNLLANPDIQSDGDGWTTWARRGEPTFAVDTAIGHADAPSLRITADATGVDGAWLQAMVCEGGTPYRYSFWFRAGPGLEGVSFLAEFTGAGGAYLGQHNRRIAAGPEEWTLAEGQIDAPPNASSMSFGVWVNLDNAGQGTAWFDDLSLSPDPRPILRFDISRPLSRVLLPGDDTIECVLRQTNPAAAPVEYRISLGFGGEVSPPSVGELRDEARVEWPAPAGLGEHTVSLQARQDGELLIRTDESIIRRSSPPRVAIGRDRELTVDGEPFFPIGVYWAAQDDLATVAGHGFNCIHAHQRANDGGTAFLDKAHALGLSVVLEMSDALRGEPDLAAIGRRAQWFREHPALLCYYPVDEPHPQSTDPAVMREAYNLLKRTDPDHPVMYVQCNMALLEPYISATDIQVVDPYTPVSIVGDWVEAGSDASGHAKPVWSVIGTFPWAGDGKGVPTSAYTRAATYASLIRGAKGLLYFSYHYPEFVLSQSHIWDALGDLNREVATMAPVLLSCEPKPIDAGEGVLAALLEGDGGPMLLVANASAEAQATARVPLPDCFGTARDLFTDTTYDCAESVELRLPPHGTAALRLPAE